MCTGLVIGASKQPRPRPWFERVCPLPQMRPAFPGKQRPEKATRCEVPAAFTCVCRSLQCPCADPFSLLLCQMVLKGRDAGASPPGFKPQLGH